MTNDDEPAWREIERRTLEILKTPEDFKRLGWPERWEPMTDWLVFVGGDLCVSMRQARLMGLTR